MLKKGVKQDCKLVVDTEENILNGTAVQTPKGLLATAMEKVSYGEQLSEEERMAIADALEESLAGNYLGDAARYACSYTASYGIPMRDGEVDYLALSADSFPTEIKTTKGTVPFTVGRMRADDMGSGAQVPETLRFTAADGSTVDAYTLWTNGGCIGELIQSDGTYGIFETEDGRYTLEKLNDNTEAETAAQETTPAESPAEETLQKDAAANAASPAAEAAQTTAQTTAQTAAQTAKADLPDYSYTGTGNAAIMNAITDYMEKMASQYGAADVMIPNIQVAGVDDSNPNDIKVYGDFWVLNYNLTGKTLENTAGGSYPGLMHLAQTAAGYVVTRFESADDGANFQESLERICADHPEMANVLLNSELNDDLRVDTIKNYVKSNGLDIDFFKDYGWDPVAVD